MENLEILAPAGNFENLNVAINAGADAVYLGLENFNARMSADNFSTQNIKDVVRFCHSLNVKVYVTVNTLVNNDEMPKVLETVKACVEAKVDAYLVQDFGVLSALKTCFPNICLHASTQMGVHNLKGAQMAEKLGCTRVVLSRETKLEDIKEIKKHTNLEIEYFVQGALCIAFSGNCYFSGMVLGESGNRGRCKQFCRMKYKTSLNGEEEYLLSARDLCLLKNLKALIDAGVTSFKIEGRLRNPGYVFQSVSSYKFALQKIKENKQIDFEQETQKLKKVFSRGDYLEDAYLFNGVPDNVVFKTVQNHTGIKIGKVLKTEKFKDLFRVTILSDLKLKSGDGLKFFDNGKEVSSLGVGNLDDLGGQKYRIYTKRNLKENLDVNLILDSGIEKQAHENIKKLDFSCKIIANAEKCLQVNLCCENLNFEYVSNHVLEKAKNQALSNEEIASQFSKVGDTIFRITSCDVETDGVFIPKSVLNGFRRDALKELENKIIEKNEKNILASVDENKLKEVLNLEFKENNLEFENIVVVNEGNMIFVDKNLKNLYVFSPQNYSLENVLKFKELFKGFLCGVELPNLANNSDVKLLDEILEKNKDFYVLINNLYGLSYVGSYKVICSIGMNVFSDYTISFLKSLGVKACVISCEQQKENIKFLKDSFVYSVGFVPLMTFAHCPYKTTNNNSCKNCSFNNNLSYFDIHDNQYRIYRYRLSQCYFKLLHSHLVNNLGYYEGHKLIDLNGLDEKRVKNALSALNKNCKIKLTNKDIFGKLNHQVS